MEKVLESKAKELIPKIADAVDFLCETKASELKEAAAKKGPAPLPSTPAQSNTTTSVTETVKSDFVDLSLPIDIPGLRTPIALSAGTSTSGKKDNLNGTDTKQNKARQKGNSDGTNSTKAGNKSKGVVNPKTVTPSVSKDSGKIKGEQTQNKDKEISVTEKETVSLEKSGKEKKVSARIPKKQKKDKDTVEKQDVGTVKNVDKEQPETHKADTESSTRSQSIPSKEKNKPPEEPDMHTPAKRRSARLASQTESKADSESDDQGCDKETDLAASNSTSRKRQKSSINPASKKARVMISSSSDEFEYEEVEVSSGGYESDTDQQSEEDLSKKDKPRKTKRKRKLHDATTELLPFKKSKPAPVTSPTPDISRPNKRKTKPPRRISSRSSKSPPVVVTRYNRSVKPNRRYCEGSAEASPNEEELEETERDLTQSSEIVKTNTKLDTTRPCDVNAGLEIDDCALVSEKEGMDEVVYTMTNPKPIPLKIRKTQVKALRSRQKTNTRISFFCHR